MQNFKKLALQASRPLVLGMVHVRALPGSPLNKLSINSIEKLAVEEATVLANFGMDGLIVENMHDIPYRRPNQIQPDTVSCMTRVCCAISTTLSDSDLLLGVQVLSSGNMAALAIALAANFHFIRCEGYVFGHIGDEGYVQSCAAMLQRYRKHIGAEHVQILTDIKKKHSSHSITSDVSLESTGEAAQFFLSDGVIITGETTGHAPTPESIESVKARLNIPVIVGSGVTDSNLETFSNAHALIVGSHFKQNGLWSEPLDKDRIRMFMTRLESI